MAEVSSPVVTGGPGSGGSGSSNGHHGGSSSGTKPKHKLHVSILSATTKSFRKKLRSRSRSRGRSSSSSVGSTEIGGSNRRSSSSGGGGGNNNGSNRRRGRSRNKHNKKDTDQSQSSTLSLNDDASLYTDDGANNDGEGGEYGDSSSIASATSMSTTTTSASIYSASATAAAAASSASGGYHGGRYTVYPSSSMNGSGHSGTHNSGTTTQQPSSSSSVVSCDYSVSVQSASTEYNKMLALQAIERESGLVLGEGGDRDRDSRGGGGRRRSSVNMPSLVDSTDCGSVSSYRSLPPGSNPHGNGSMRDDDECSVRTSRTVDWEAIEGSSSDEDVVTVSKNKPSSSSSPSPSSKAMPSRNHLMAMKQQGMTRSGSNLNIRTGAHDGSLSSSNVRRKSCGPTVGGIPTISSTSSPGEARLHRSGSVSSMRSGVSGSSPPKIDENRAHTSFDDEAGIMRIFILLLAPRTRRFELIPLEIPAPSTVTVSEVYQSMVPKHATEKSLRKQRYVGLCRSSLSPSPSSSVQEQQPVPSSSSSGNKKKTKYEELFPSKTLADIGIRHNDVFIALPEMKHCATAPGAVYGGKSLAKSSMSTAERLLRRGSSSKSMNSDDGSKGSTNSKGSKSSQKQQQQQQEVAVWSPRDIVKMGNVILSNPRVKRLIQYAAGNAGGSDKSLPRSKKRSSMTTSKEKDRSAAAAAAAPTTPPKSNKNVRRVLDEGGATPVINNKTAAAGTTTAAAVGLEKARKHLFPEEPKTTRTKASTTIHKKMDRKTTLPVIQSEQSLNLSRSFEQEQQETRNATKKKDQQQYQQPKATINGTFRKSSSSSSSSTKASGGTTTKQQQLNSRRRQRMIAVARVVLIGTVAISSIYAGLRYQRGNGFEHDDVKPNATVHPNNDNVVDPAISMVLPWTGRIPSSSDQKKPVVNNNVPKKVVKVPSPPPVSGRKPSTGGGSPSNNMRGRPSATSETSTEEEAIKRGRSPTKKKTATTTTKQERRQEVVVNKRARSPPPPPPPKKSAPTKQEKPAPPVQDSPKRKTVRSPPRKAAPAAQQQQQQQQPRREDENRSTTATLTESMVEMWELHIMGTTPPVVEEPEVAVTVSEVLRDNVRDILEPLVLQNYYHHR